MYHRAGLFNIRLPLVRRRQDFCKQGFRSKTNLERFVIVTAWLIRLSDLGTPLMQEDVNTGKFSPATLPMPSATLQMNLKIRP